MSLFEKPDLYDLVSKKNLRKGCVILSVCEVIPAPDSNRHFITDMEYDGKSFRLHTITGLRSSYEVSTRIVNDIDSSLNGQKWDEWYYFEPSAPVQVKSVQEHKSSCPLCGKLGDDLVVKFYCSNNGCKNYHP